MDKQPPHTLILDLDGTLIKHHGSLEAQMTTRVELLPGVKEKLTEWERLGCRILILTGRKESMRDVTIRQLAEAGIIYDALIMGVGGGMRIIINDRKPDGSLAALAIAPQRNEGLVNVQLPV